MSILRSDELGEHRTGSTEFQNGRLIVRSSRSWRVTCDTQYDDDQEVLTAAIIASPDPIANDLDAHPTNGDLLCRSRRAEQETGGDGVSAYSWLVRAEYDNQSNSQDAEDAETPPLDRRTRWHMEFNDVEVVQEYDQEGVLIQNTAGDVFDPPLVESESRPILVGKKNYDAGDLSGLMALVADYTNCVNSDTFLGRPPGSWHISKPQMSEEQSEGDVRYHVVSWPLELKGEYEFPDPSTVEGSPDPWDRVVLNRGFNHLTTPNDKETKAPIAGKEPRNLKEDGTLFIPTADPNYFYRTFKTKKRRPFSAIGLV